MKAVHAIAFLLVVIGGLNWGLMGINADWNVVHMLLSWSSMVERLVYILVGLSAIYLAVSHKNHCKMCEAKAPMASM
jgi:hypothetical protein